MYKIYINEKLLIFVDEAEKENFRPKNEFQMFVPYHNNRRHLLNYVDMLEKSSTQESVVLYTPDVEQLFEDFKRCFKLIEAAGGFVFNPTSELLCIYRRGFWDLPKGKIDEGEDAPTTAIREVQEETGLKEIKLGDFITHTWHTYRTKKKTRVLKKTHWYRMETQELELVPQKEEDIEAAVWLQPEDFLAKGKLVYLSLRETVKNYLDNNE